MMKMLTQVLVIVLFLIGCQREMGMFSLPKDDASVLTNLRPEVFSITNNTPDTIIAELYMYPAEGYLNNKAGAFSKVIVPDESFVLTYDGEFIFEKNVEISSCYEIDEQLGYDVLIYRDIYKNMIQDLIIYGDTEKDTVYARRHTIDEIMKAQPLRINIE